MTCSLFFMTCPYHIHNLFITLFSKYHNCYLSITPLCSRALPSQTWSLKIFWTQKVLYYEKCLDQQLFHKPNTQPPLGLMLTPGRYFLHDILGVCILHQEFPVKKWRFIAPHAIECLKTHSLFFLICFWWIVCSKFSWTNRICLFIKVLVNISCEI